MTKILVWDLPTRLFHWLLTFGFLASSAIAMTVDDDSALFSVHMILGLVLAAMVLLRIIWGFIGTRYARFSSFLFSPAAVLQYGKESLANSGKPSIGHNPGSSYAIFAMLGLVLTTAVTGIMISRGNEAAEEFHEVSSYALMAVVALHVAGVAWYTIRHKENITLSMVTGYKQAAVTDGVTSSRPIVGLLFLVVVGFLSIRLFQNHDATLGRTGIPELGIVIKLGEAESGEGNESDEH